jgi:hypothetical protein
MNSGPLLFVLLQLLLLGVPSEVCLDMANDGRFRLEDPVGREAFDAADIFMVLLLLELTEVLLLLLWLELSNIGR